MPKFFKIFLLIFFLFPSLAMAKDFSIDNDISIIEEYFPDEIEKNNDPFEPFNRAIFSFNKFSYDYFLKYIVKAYSFVTPDFLEGSLVNFFHNLEKPYIILNSLLKLEFANAGIVFSTFVINSTIGFFGFFDLTIADNIRYKNVNFDNVLEFYQIPQGPYLILPFLGPSTLRSAVANGAISSSNYQIQQYYLDDSHGYLSQQDYMSYAILKNLVRFDKVSDYIDDIYRNSMDPYSIVKSYYLQRK